jgi:hypothetical protein
MNIAEKVAYGAIYQLAKRLPSGWHPLISEDGGVSVRNLKEPVLELDVDGVTYKREFVISRLNMDDVRFYSAGPLLGTQGKEAE